MKKVPKNFYCSHVAEYYWYLWKTTYPRKSELYHLYFEEYAMALHAVWE